MSQWESVALINECYIVEVMKIPYLRYGAIITLLFYSKKTSLYPSAFHFAQALTSLKCTQDLWENKAIGCITSMFNTFLGIYVR